MHRLLIAAGVAGVTVVAAACGSSASGATTTQASSTASDSAAAGRGQGANGARGEVVRVSGSSLILNTSNGDLTVDYTSATTVLQTSTAALADIAPGGCIVAIGRKDASGQVTITSVSLADAVNGACAGALGQGGGGFFGPNGSPGAAGAPTPNPSRSPRPQAANFAAVRGLVKAVAGTSITITPTGGGSAATVTVPTTVPVSKTSTAVVADLAVGDCVAATGAKDSSGTVSARTLSIQPAGPSGCFTGGRGGFGGGGGLGGSGTGGAATTAAG